MPADEACKSKSRRFERYILHGQLANYPGWKNDGRGIVRGVENDRKLAGKGIVRMPSTTVSSAQQFGLDKCIS